MWLKGHESVRAPTNSSCLRLKHCCGQSESTHLDTSQQVVMVAISIIYQEVDCSFLPGACFEFERFGLALGCKITLHKTASKYKTRHVWKSKNISTGQILTVLFLIFSVSCGKIHEDYFEIWIMQSYCRVLHTLVWKRAAWSYHTSSC